MKNLKWWIGVLFFGSMSISFFLDIFRGKPNIVAMLITLALTYYFWMKTKSSVIKGTYSIQVTSYEYFQPQLKSAFFNRKNEQNVIINSGVKLVPEPTNRHDPNAIMVLLDGVQIGYIPSLETDEVRRRLKQQASLRMYTYNDYTRCELTLK